MPIEQPVSAVNNRPNQQVMIVCNCDLLWSLAHQFSYLRLSDQSGDNEYQLIKDYAVRAKRIAATYARFYLETEQGGNKDKQGRYYWMALAAFASKSVACVLDHPSVKTQAWVVSDTVTDGLGQGNFWLFNDIAASHWLYNNYHEHFHQGMMCEQKRDADQLEGPVKAIIEKLPWAKESIDKINRFKPTKKIIQGFDYIRQIELLMDEGIYDEDDVAVLQMQQLLAIADHEQLSILQTLVYDNPDFSDWTQVQRNWALARWLSPEFQVSFSHLCEVDDPELKSVAPGDLIIENFESRMEWIGDIADLFHFLMGKNSAYMLQALSTIAAWVDTPDD